MPWKGQLWRILYYSHFQNVRQRTCLLWVSLRFNSTELWMFLGSFEFNSKLVLKIEHSSLHFHRNRRHTIDFYNRWIQIYFEFYFNRFYIITQSFWIHATNWTSQKWNRKDLTVDYVYSFSYQNSFELKKSRLKNQFTFLCYYQINVIHITNHINQLNDDDAHQKNLRSKIP